MHCFTVLPSDEGKTLASFCLKKPNANSLINICAFSKTSKDEWMKAITEYKNCDVEVVKTDENDNIIDDETMKNEQEDLNS